MNADTCQLTIRVGRYERLRVPIMISTLQETGALLDRYLRGIVWEGPATVLVEMPSGVTHIVGRYPAGTVFLNGDDGRAA